MGRHVPDIGVTGSAGAGGGYQFDPATGELIANANTGIIRYGEDGREPISGGGVFGDASAGAGVGAQGSVVVNVNGMTLPLPQGWNTPNSGVKTYQAGGHTVRVVNGQITRIDNASVHNSIPMTGTEYSSTNYGLEIGGSRDREAGASFYDDRSKPLATHRTLNEDGTFTKTLVPRNKNADMTERRKQGNSIASLFAYEQKKSGLSPAEFYKMVNDPRLLLGGIGF